MGVLNLWRNFKDESHHQRRFFTPFSAVLIRVTLAWCLSKQKNQSQVPFFDFWSSKIIRLLFPLSRLNHVGQPNGSLWIIGELASIINIMCHQRTTRLLRERLPPIKVITVPMPSACSTFHINASDEPSNGLTFYSRDEKRIEELDDAYRCTQTLFL